MKQKKLFIATDLLIVGCDKRKKTIDSDENRSHFRSNLRCNPSEQRCSTALVVFGYYQFHVHILGSE